MVGIQKVEICRGRYKVLANNSSKECGQVRRECSVCGDSRKYGEHVARNLLGQAGKKRDKSRVPRGKKGL